MALQPVRILEPWDSGREQGGLLDTCNGRLLPVRVFASLDEADQFADWAQAFNEPLDVLRDEWDTLRKCDCGAPTESRLCEECAGCVGDRRVALTVLGDTEVSTVMVDDECFETLVLGASERAGESRRYATWEQAEAGHNEMVKELRCTTATS